MTQCYINLMEYNAIVKVESKNQSISGWVGSEFSIYLNHKMTIRNVTEPRRDSLMAATYFLRFGLGALPALLGLADRFLDVTNPVTQYKYILWIFPVQLMYTWLRMRYPDWLRLYELSMLCLLDKFSNTFFQNGTLFKNGTFFKNGIFFSGCPE